MLNQGGDLILKLQTDAAGLLLAAERLLQPGAQRGISLPFLSARGSILQGAGAAVAGLVAGQLGCSVPPAGAAITEVVRSSSSRFIRTSSAQPSTCWSRMPRRRVR